MSARGTCSRRASGRGPIESRSNQPRRTVIPVPRVGRTLAHSLPLGEQEGETPSLQPISGTDPAPTVADSVTRAVCLVDELDALPQLVDEIEVVGVGAIETAVAAGIRELIEHLRAQAAAMVSLVDRLERIAAPS